jgi:N-glycosylase/DNA lyase
VAEFVLPVLSPFSLDYTLESGQVFRWRRKGGWWYGVVSGEVMKARQKGDSVICVTGGQKLDSPSVRSYFRLDVDLEGILASIMKDEEISLAVQKFYGLRLVRQDPWECLASFVLATNSNIPRIEGMVASLSERFGESIEFEGDTFHSFPSPASLAEAEPSALDACGLGYRAPFIRHVSKVVRDGGVDLLELGLRTYEEARDILLRELPHDKALLGVGPKVADCVLLYSCGKDEAFPIDVWVARALSLSHPEFFPKKVLAALDRGAKVRLGWRDYQHVSQAARGYYGEYAGFAQQYIYMDARTSEPRPFLRGSSAPSTSRVRRPRPAAHPRARSRRS